MYNWFESLPHHICSRVDRLRLPVNFWAALRNVANHCITQYLLAFLRSKKEERQSPMVALPLVYSAWDFIFSQVPQLLTVPKEGLINQLRRRNLCINLGLSKRGQGPSCLTRFKNFSRGNIQLNTTRCCIRCSN